MYSERVTAAAIERAEAKLGIRLYRYDPQLSLELTDYLSQRHSQGKLVDNAGHCLRRDDAAFIRNERTLFQHDFTYACRYLKLILDGGGIGALNLWESQRILMALVARIEERNVDGYMR